MEKSTKRNIAIKISDDNQSKTLNPFNIFNDFGEEASPAATKAKKNRVKYR